MYDDIMDRFVPEVKLRDYLKTADLDAYDVAEIIYNAPSPIEEKRAALRQLGALNVACLNEYRESWKNLGSVIDEAINLLHRESSIFQLYEEEFSVYQYSFFCNGDQSWCEDFTELYWAKEDCWEKIREDLDLGISRIIVRKRFIGKECAYIDAEFTADEKLVSVYSAGILDEEDWNILNGVFDGLWFDFPIPFKKGDVVYQRQKPGPRFEELIFVLDDAIPLNESIKNMDFYKKWADNSDMSAWGYFQDDDGRVYHECMHNYMDF